MARPTIRSPKIEERILSGIRNGQSLSTICESKTLPAKETVFEWLASDEARRAGNQVPEGEVTFLDHYRIATRIRTDAMQEEILAISDDGKNDTYKDKDGNVTVDYDHIQRCKLRVDTRKWLMAKLEPKRFGDKPADISVQTHVHNNTVTIERQKEIQARMREALQG